MNWEQQNQGVIDHARAQGAVLRNWYALRVDAQEVHRAIDLLPQVGVLGFVPVEEVIQKTGRKKKTAKIVTRPVMTGYVIAGFIDAPNWFATFQLSMIYGVVARDGRPARISGDAMAELFGIHRVAAPALPGLKSLKRGDQIRVTEGGWKGHEAKLLDIAGEQCELMLSLFGKPFRARMAITEVEAA